MRVKINQKIRKGSEILPFFVIREDITRLKADAIVNSTNRDMKPDGGADGAIHSAAGKLFSEECARLAPLELGEAKITAGYDLPAKYVIHVSAPVWQGGGEGECEALCKCYKNALSLAVANGCESVGFSLMASGAYGFPRTLAAQCAERAIREFIENEELTVYLAVFDKASYLVGKSLFSEVKSYIDDETFIGLFSSYPSRDAERRERSRGVGRRRVKFESADSYFSIAGSNTADDFFAIDGGSLDDMLKNIDDPFSVTLLKLIDAKGMSDVECYKRSNVSKKTFWKIVNQKDYRPSKATVLSFAIGLSLSLSETEHLLSTVGFALSRSSKFDIIVKYFITNGKYDIFEINEALFKFDQPLLGCG